MARRMAPSQHPKPRKTARGSRTRWEWIFGRRARRGVVAIAMCVPNEKAERERPISMIRTARTALTLQPGLRGRCPTFLPERSLERARKASRRKEEKEVKDPQKPTERPM